MLKRQYRSDQHDLARDFYERGLAEANTFGRAVGFFSSSVLNACRKAFHEFFSNDGRYRVVCSHLLSGSDVERLVRGYGDRHEFIGESRLGLLDRETSLTPEELDELVPWLVAKGKLDVQIALPNEFSGAEQYHEKLGFFEDEEGDTVVFTGSANETYQALKGNFELIDVFRSWRDDERRRALDNRENFEDLWMDETDELDVMPFPVAARRGVIEKRSPGAAASVGVLTNPAPDSSETVEVSGLHEFLRIPSYIRLYDHQKTAIREWLKAPGRGILEMATGSGKTISALGAATKLYEFTGPPLVVVVIAPYLHLVDQWVEEARNFGLDPLVCARGRQEWYEDYQIRAFNAGAGNRKITSVFATTATFRTDAFQEILEGIAVPTVLIGDEVHNLGAPNTRRCLPRNADFRLGLSATPERWHDESGTEALTDYFGSKLEGAEYTLAQALEDDVLCPYLYYPHQIELAGDEIEAYMELTGQIAKAIGSDDALNEPSEKAKRLLIRRARLLASAENKLSKLRELMVDQRRSTHNLVYCGDGRVNEPATDEEMRQIEAVTRMLGRELEMRVAKYTAETDTARRRSLREQFASGDVQCLVAIRCLDEGVDIPETRRAFILASSSNPRQFIQRRGRILRQAPGKGQAEIHDFLVVPPERYRDRGSEHFGTTRKLFKKELKRAIEFAKLAENGPQAMGSLLELRDDLNLLDMGVEENVRN